MKLPPCQVRVIDRPELPETFVDSMGLSTFDGPTVRLEFCVTRLDAPNPPAQATGTRYTACRLVMQPDLAIDLYNQLQGMLGAMEQQGIIKRTLIPTLLEPGSGKLN